MARIELQGFHDRFSQDELDQLDLQLEALGARLELDDGGEVEVVATDLAGIALEEFYEQLEPYNAAADIYLPADFKGTLELHELRLVSSHRLASALRKIQDTSVADDAPLAKRQLEIWKRLRYGATQSIKRNLILDVDRD